MKLFFRLIISLFLLAGSTAVNSSSLNITPKITGPAYVGQTLTADAGEPQSDHQYQWFYSYAWMQTEQQQTPHLIPIRGATSRDYRTTKKDLNALIAVKISLNGQTATSPLRLIKEGGIPLKDSKKPITLTLKGFHFSGNESHSDYELNKALKEFIGRKVGLSELNNAANTVMKYYKNNSNVVVSAQIPAQEITRNRVKMIIIEGHVGKIHVSNNNHYNSDFILQYAADNIQESQLLQLNKLEKTLLSLNQNAGLHVSSRLERGQQRGEVDVRFNVDDKKAFNATLAYNNHGSEAISQDRYLLGLNLFNLRNRGGHFSAELLSGTQYQELHYSSLRYEEPIVAWSGHAGLSIGSGTYEVANQLDGLNLQGDNETLSFFLRHALILKRNLKLNAEVTLAASNAVFSLLGQTSNIDRSRTLAFKLHSTLNALAGENQLSFTLKQGLGEILGAMKNNAKETSRQDADNRFTTLRLSASHLHPLTPRWSAYGALSGQWTEDKLLASEEWQIGGIDSVRGHFPGAQNGSRGYQSRLELRYSRQSSLPLIGALPWVAYSFMDYGSVDRQASITPNKDHWLSGAGFGFNSQKQLKDLTANLSLNLGWPLYLADSKTQNPDRSPLFTLSTSLTY